MAKKGSKKTGDPSIAIALGAGGARGLVHIHTLQALDELGIRPKAIAGCSIGAIMGAGYAAGLSAKEIEEYTRERFRHRLKLMADLWRMRPDTVATFIREGGPRLGYINIERVLELFLPPDVPQDFSDLKIPMQIVASDYYGRCDKVFSKGPLRPAIAASAAIPAVFRPVVIDGEVYIDGGMTNPAPFDLIQGKADIIIAVDVAGGPEGERGSLPGKIDIMYASAQLMQLAISDAKAQCNQVDILLRPSMGNVRALDFMKTRQILDKTANVKDDLKREIERVLKVC